MPVKVPNLSGIVHIAAGRSHSLAVKNDGTVWEWGRVPTQKSGLINVAAVAVGDNYNNDAFSVAIKRNGEMWVWGKSYLLQLREKPFYYRKTPIQLFRQE